jgi:hypothetical protein
VTPAAGYEGVIGEKLRDTCNRTGRFQLYEENQTYNKLPVKFPVYSDSHFTFIEVIKLSTKFKKVFHIYIYIIQNVSTVVKGIQPTIGDVLWPKNYKKLRTKKL